MVCSAWGAEEMKVICIMKDWRRIRVLRNLVNQGANKDHLILVCGHQRWVKSGGLVRHGLRPIIMRFRRILVDAWNHWKTTNLNEGFKFC